MEKGGRPHFTKNEIRSLLISCGSHAHHRLKFDTLVVGAALVTESLKWSEVRPVCLLRVSISEDLTQATSEFQRVGILMSVEFDRGSPGNFDSRTLNRTTLDRWTGRMKKLVRGISKWTEICVYIYIYSTNAKARRVRKATYKGPPEYCQGGTVTHLNYNRLLWNIIGYYRL